MFEKCELSQKAMIIPKSKRRELLLSLKETEVHKNLKILFSNMSQIILWR